MDERTIDVSIKPQAIRAQVGRILQCEGFVRSRRMQRFLEFVVEETLAGRTDQLGEYALGVAVFDRGEDFEPALDPIVRNDARRLRLKLLEYYRQAGPQETEVLIEIPKGGYVPVFRPIGATVDDRCIEHPRLAVLPFEVLSDAPETAGYGRALCLSLTAGLTGLDGLDAVAHACLAERSMREAVAELRLSHVIQGVVLKAGERCRVIVNLIHVTQGTQMWAREYDFDSSEMLTVQSQIAANVLGVVRSRIGRKHSQCPVDLAAVRGTPVSARSWAA